MKFQVGDRIKLTEAVAEFGGGPFYEAPPGTTGTIKETVQWPVYGVTLDDGKTHMGGYHEHELELLEDEEMKRDAPEEYVRKLALIGWAIDELPDPSGGEHTLEVAELLKLARQARTEYEEVVEEAAK